VFRAYFRILSDDEKAKLLSDLAGLEDVRAGLTGPEIVKTALKGLGVTGAKVAQVLATHKGLVPEEYARPLESFKDRAQDFDKMRAFSVISERMARLSGLTAPADTAAMPSSGEMSAWAREALPKESEVERRRMVRQVEYLLKDQGRKMRWMELLGRELGSGSIKVVYKIGLDDGRIWVAKLRAPGAAYRTGREFEILDGLITELQAEGDLKTPGAAQLLEEVKSLVNAEMDFRDESGKQKAMTARGAQRPWYAALIAGLRPRIARPHPVYVGEDLMIEEYMDTTRFTDLPVWSPVGPSQRSIARQAVQEGMLDLILDGRLEPDPHTGNRHASHSWFDRLRSRLVVMDVGQEVGLPIDVVKPLLKAGVALEAGDVPGAARMILSIVQVPDTQSAEVVEKAVIGVLQSQSQSGIVERLVAALLEAEKNDALVKPQYAALEKAFLIYTGYDHRLPKDYIYKSIERAVAVRVLRDRPVSVWTLLKLQVKRLLLGAASVRAELDGVIDKL
ncbi:MAG: AarF/UbiB family protein, partial [Elusimicrobiota bacterium]